MFNRNKKYPPELLEYFNQSKEEAKKLKSTLVDEKAHSDKERNEYKDRLKSMIDYAINRHDWYDEQRNRFLNIGISLFAFGGAFGAIISQLVDNLNIVTTILSWVLTVSLILIGIWMLYVYNAGVSTDHPYRKVADIRSWYFFYNFPEGDSDKLSTDPAIAKKQIENVLKNLRKFIERWLEYTKDKNGFFKEDLEQVFILQILQGYRYQQVKKMSSILTRGLITSGILLALIMLSLALDLRKEQKKSPKENAAIQTDTTKVSKIPIIRVNPNELPDSVRK